MYRRQWNKLAHIARKLGVPSPDKSRLSTPSKQPPAPTPRLKRFRRSLRKYGKRLWVVGLGIVALVGFAYQFKPDVTIDVDLTLDPKEPFATQFKITNIGLLALYDMKFSCGIENQNMHNVTISNFPAQSAIDVLNPKDSATKGCPAMGKGDFVVGMPTPYPFKSDVEMVVTARPSWYWGRFEWDTRFVNVRDSDGILKWVRQPSRWIRNSK